MQAFITGRLVEVAREFYPDGVQPVVKRSLAGLAVTARDKRQQVSDLGPCARNRIKPIAAPQDGAAVAVGKFQAHAFERFYRGKIKDHSKARLPPPSRRNFVKSVQARDHVVNGDLVGKARQHVSQNSCLVHRQKGRRDDFCGQKFDGLVGDAFGTDGVQSSLFRLDGVERSWIRNQIKTGPEPEKTQDAQVVLADARDGTADKGQTARGDVGQAVVKIINLAVLVLVQGIHREVTAFGVFFEGCAVIGNHGAASVGGNIATQRRDFNVAVGHDQGDGAVFNSRGNNLEAALAEQFHHDFRAGRSGDVVVFWITTHNHIPDTTTSKPCHVAIGLKEP